MAFASVGTLGAAFTKTSNQASASLTTTATLEAGNLGIYYVAVDNFASTDGDSSEVTGVVDSAGNTWTKIVEWTNSDGASQAGVTTSVWYVVATNQLTSGGTITASYTNATSRDCTAHCAWEFTLGSASVEVVGTDTDVKEDSGSHPTLDVTTDGVTEHLRIQVAGGDNASGGSGGADTGWTHMAFTSATGGSSTSNTCCDGQYLITTAANASTVHGVSGATAANAQVYAALKEAAAAPETLEGRFAGAGSQSALANLRMAGRATLPGAGSLSARGNLQMRVTATFGGAGSLSANAVRVTFGRAIFAGEGTLSADAVVTTPTGDVHTGEATFEGTGDLSAYANLRMAARAHIRRRRFDVSTGAAAHARPSNIRWCRWSIRSGQPADGDRRQLCRRGHALGRRPGGNSRRRS